MAVRSFPDIFDDPESVEEVWEALLYARAVDFCLNEAKNSKPAGIGCGEFTFDDYGFENAVAAREAMTANPISVMFRNVSTLPEMNELQLKLIREEAWEDLKTWAFPDGIPIPDPDMVKEPAPPQCGEYRYSLFGATEFISWEQHLAEVGIWDPVTKTGCWPPTHNYTGPGGGKYIVFEVGAEGATHAWDESTRTLTIPSHEYGDSALLGEGVIDEGQAAWLLAIGYGENVARRISTGYQYTVTVGGNTLFSNRGSQHGGMLGVGPMRDRFMRSLEAPGPSVTCARIQEVRPWVMEKLAGDKEVAEIIEKIEKFIAPAKKMGLGTMSRGSGAPKGTKKVKSASIWDQQCFLIENIKRLAASAADYQYDNFSSIAGKPGNLVSKLNSGPATEENLGSIDTILNLTPDVYALMVPYIKLYRVLYDKDNVHRILGEQEIPFESFTSREDLNNIFTSRESRQAGAGLKSFDWTLKGVQPEEVDNNITATLQVHFQSVQDLFRHNIDPSAASGDEAQAGLADPGFLDLIIAPETQKAVLGDAENSNKKFKCSRVGESRVYDGALYRIKIEVGWAVPDGLENMPGLAASADAVREAIAMQRKTLFLQLARHNIDFQQDGTVKLNIEYQAALNGIMRSSWSDIFADDTELESVFDDPDSECSQMSSDRVAGELTDPKKRKQYKEKCLDPQIEANQQDRLVKYRRILSTLYRGGKINSIRVPMKELLLAPWSELTAEERAARAKRRQSANPSDYGFVINQGKNSGAKELLKNAKNGSALDKDNLSKIGKSLNSIKEATPSQSVDIHYFYLGDLMDSVLGLKHIRTQIDNNSFQLVLGTVEMIDPLVAYQITNLQEITACRALRGVKGTLAAAAIEKINPLATSGGQTGIIEHMDMASIPISLDAFNEWFFRKIIKKGLTKYHLDQFIRDVLGSLVGRALSSRCFRGVPQVPLRFATNDFFVRGKLATDEKIQMDGEGGLRSRIRKKTKSLVGLNSSMVLLANLGDQVEIPTMIVYSTDSLPQGHRSGKEGIDRGEGIYHFYLGASAGLVKKITFNREDQQGLREAKIQREGTLGALQLRELYSVKMTMIGNTLLKNGQFIYINPSAIGAGTPSSEGSIPNLARVLGLGGYFLVTGVSHRISEAGYDVEVTALHQDIALNESPTIPLDVYTGKAEKTPSDPPKPKKKERPPRQRPTVPRDHRGKVEQKGGKAHVESVEGTFDAKQVSELAKTSDVVVENVANGADVILSRGMTKEAAESVKKQEDALARAGARPSGTRVHYRPGGTGRAE